MKLTEHKTSDINLTNDRVIHSVFNTFNLLKILYIVYLFDLMNTI